MKTYNEWRTYEGRIPLNNNTLIKTLKKMKMYLTNDANLTHIIKGNNTYPRPFDKFIQERTTNRDLVGCEVGVFEGEHLRMMRKLLHLKKVYAIDITREYYLLGRDDKVFFIEETSHEGYKYIPEPLDFVYIDAFHEYDEVKLDIQLYSKLVKKGGIIGGHDYRNFPGVHRAVNEHIQTIPEKKLYTERDDWWYVQ